MIRLVPRGALAALILAVAAALVGPALAQDEAAQSKPQPGDIFDAGETEAIRAMIREGYPPEMIHYYRGGMQAWKILGLTTVPGGF